MARNLELMSDAVRTEGPADPMFDKPYIDEDEWRDAPVPHRYVHGGFEETNTRFSIYLPPAESYQGRFFQHITPVPDSENLAQHARGEADKIGFAIASGGYFVETNGGGVWGGYGSDDPTVAGYRANAACAQYSRVVAAEMYGAHRPYGYVYGGSGGGFRTIGCMENTVGVWDGAVPYVIGSPMAIPNMFTVRMHAQRILRDRLDAIVDAVEPGGSGDPYEGLSEEERAALLEITRMGFPLRSWFGHRTMGMHAFPMLYGGMRLADPTYFEDFWAKPGYLGYEPPPSLERDRIMFSGTVVAALSPDEARAEGLPVGRRPGQLRGGVDTAWRDADDPLPLPFAFRLSVSSPVDLGGADLVVRSGKAEGTRVGLLSVHGDVAVLGPGAAEPVLEIEPGDAVEVDNSGFLAAQTYHRHQVPETDDFPVWDQFRNPDGTPRYPQRPLILGPLFAGAAAGTVQNGHFGGKMIVVESLLDREALAWQADWYRGKAEEHLGERLDDHFRLWFTDNALHSDDQVEEDPTHAVSYLGMLHQALRDLSRWVEEDIEPPANTVYEVVDGQIVVPADAAARRGIQPVASLTVDGGDRADVEVGEEVTLRVEAEVPPGTGSIVAVEWDFDGAGEFPVSDAVTPAEEAAVERRWTAPSAGTFFPVVRVVAQRESDVVTPYARLRNIARVRVVVS
jgi:hypothetical protein